MKILLISGHGAGDPGAMAKHGGRTCREADETRKVTAALREALRGYAEVDRYDTDRNAFEDHKNGTLLAIARFRDYDYVLEVHFNAFTRDAGDGRTRGVECYVTTAENGTGVEEAICRNIAALGLTNRGVKRYNFSVIRAAKQAGVPAALLEVCFLDDADDMRIYTARGAEIARAIADGIVEDFGLKRAETDAARARRIIREKTGLEEKTLDYLAAYQYGDALLQKLAGAME